MTKRTILLTSAAMLTASGSALAQDNDMVSANSILPGCRYLVANSPVEPFKQGICVGTVTATATMLTFGNVVGRSLDMPLTMMTGRPFKPDDTVNFVLAICADIPGKVTFGQEVQVVIRYVVIRYIEARPDHMHEPFQNLAQEALQKAWPCPHTVFR